MRLPDGFLDDLRARLSLSQVVGRRVTWDMRKTNQGRGDWWAPCPFHEERTPSFHVDDRKGFYYCFGCQAKGNVFGFVQETENVSFMEAVEILAAEAGMQMPARDPKAAQVADLRTRLAEVTEAAARWFRAQLGAPAGAPARAYLERRGLSPTTLERFEVGLAPAGGGVAAALRAQGVAPDLIEGAGLAYPAGDGRPAGDRFADRIVFPIRDARGHCIGFGGRAMSPHAKAKYLNSPETALFDKGANLYNVGPARAAAGKGRPLVVAEGYMDVIALAQAGFEAAVAPLGTAVTERQLHLLWRLSPEPVVALDGDAAGQAAGLRVADLALPLVAAGQSLRFATLPAGRDPDDVIRDGGASAMQAVLDRAEPMVALLWRRATGGGAFDSPERRATLDRDLRALVRRIADPGLRRHYADEIARLRADLFGGGRQARDRHPPGRPGGAASRGWRPPAQATPTARASGLASGATDPETLLERIALAGLLHHPALLPEFAAALERPDWRREDHARIATALLEAGPETAPAALRARLDASLGPAPLETLLAESHLRISPVCRADRDGARHCVRDALDRLDAWRGSDRETREALEDFRDGADEGLTWRLAEAARRRDAARRSGAADAGTGGEVSNVAYYDSLLGTGVGKRRTRK